MTNMAASTETKKPTFKRDTLMEIEARMQKYWEETKAFEVNAPTGGHLDQPKYFVTFPYPYMNGRLHLGHSFSLSKCEFAAGYERLKGKKVLFPFGFHCTGMPIKACADKLRRELETYGNPPQFPVDSDKKYQWEIMASMGVPDDEIHHFADANYWLYYFPPRAMADLKRLGVKVDWRRSFITTVVNPYYDSFVRWQFRKLKAFDKIRFGKRYTIFSPMDNQPCMDHDRQTGEGVAPQEYTIIKLEVVGDLPVSLGALKGRKVILPAATLRPETMYGQTNCYVGPELNYGAYEMANGDIFICTDRSALNLAYQGFTRDEGKLVKITSLKGSDLVGLTVKAPLAQYPKVYVLPMETVLATKGTGIVTSVPSDSPDDYMTLLDLKKKAAYYKIKEEWVQGFDPIPIISTPNYGSLAAVKVCEEMKIQSPKDKAALALAKEKVYKEGYYSGVMAVGDLAGKPVQEAKPLIRQQLIDRGEAIAYWEPEGLVMSRSGDECVVCLTDQWYLNYGENDWKADALKCLAGMNLFHEEVRNNFTKTLDWLREWACSRSYGLGSRLPWDEQWLIESLSDSTIYMAYYTIAHMLHSGALDGSKPGLAGIKPEDLTDAVWDYIFLAPKDAEPPKESYLATDKLKAVKTEFEYFYPLDLRVSGKDLITNHLSFFIYNHVALFKESHWPRAIRANGHVMINNAKMSKSTGNFLTLVEAVDSFSADGTRFALAESGDGVEDANFEMDIANATILKLFTLKEWIENVHTEVKAGKLRDGIANLFDDRVFEHEMNRLIQLTDNSYSNMLYYDVCKFGFHELTNARDRYINVCNTVGIPMNKNMILRYIEIQAIIMCPIIPHFSEYVWREVLHKNDSVTIQPWPKATKVDDTLLAAKDYVDRLMREARLTILNVTQPKKKKGPKVDVPVLPPTEGRVYVAKKFPEWQESVVAVLKELSKSGPLPDLKALVPLFSKDDRVKPHMKNKKLMPFVREMLERAGEIGIEALDRKTAFVEREILDVNAELIRLSLGLKDLRILDEPRDEVDELQFQAAVPGEPSFAAL